MTTTNNEVACRCAACRKASTNDKGLLWDLNDLEAGPLRDLEINA